MHPADDVSRAALRVVALLVDKKYADLASLTANQRLTATMMMQAINDYGRTLIMPPEGDLPPDFQVVHEVANRHRHHAVMSLWTKEEGQSDLALELTLIETGPKVEIVVDNIVVM